MDDIQIAVEYKMGSDTQEEFGPSDVENAKNKTLTKILSHVKFLDSLF